MKGIFFLLFSFSSFLLSAQSIAIDKIKLDKKIDSLFQSYNNKNSPGFAITVIQNEKMITKKDYGMASLEHSAPFTHNTVVRLPYSEGREFISIAAVLMENDGILNFNDKVRTYFPELPEWSEPVTIRDLLDHRSGLADEWSMIELTQASMQNRVDVEQFLTLLYRQPKPEVKPGIGFMYSNSDFGLLRLILEKASEQNLSRWMEQHLFAPLGMTSTRLHDDKDDVIAGFAPQYYRYGKDGYKTWSSYKTSPGGNYYIATSVNDLEKWVLAHKNAASFIAKATASLFQDAQLMPGSDKNYVFGYKIKSLGTHEVFTHQGAGNHTYISRTKNPDFTVILLSNSLGEPYPFHESVLAYLLNYEKPVFKNKQFNSEKVQYSLEELRQFTGNFLNADTVTYESFVKNRRDEVTFVIHNDSLKLKDNDVLISLEYVSSGVFKDVDYPTYFEFTRSGNDYKAQAHSHGKNSVITLIRDTSKKWQPSLLQLQSYTGKYYSPHLDFYWTIELGEDNRLIIKRPTIRDTELQPDTNREFKFNIENYSDTSFPAWLKFYADASGRVTHFMVHHARLMGHKFDKVR